MDDINDRTTALLGFDLRDIIKRSRDLGVEAAEARAQAEYLEHYRKVVLSEQIIAAHHNARSAGDKLTGPEAESRARTSVPYRDCLTDLREAQGRRGSLYARAAAAAQAVDLGFRQLSFLQTELRGQDR